MTEARSVHDRYLQDFRTLEASRAARPPAWLRRVREEALARFSALGFPTARRGNEKWKYTNVGPVAEADFAYPFEAGPALEPAAVRRVAPWDESWLNLVFVNGRYAPALSSPPRALAAAHAGSLEAAVRADGRLIEDHLARHATFDDDGFTALNTAFLRDGAFVNVPDGGSPPAPLHLLFLSVGDGRRTVSYPRTLIVAGRQSRLTVIESYVSLSRARHFTDAVTEVVLDKGAQMEHYRLVMEGRGGFHVGTSRVRQAEDSGFTSTGFARGAAIGRNDIQVLLDGPGGSCALNGLYLTKDREHIDHYIVIDHAKPHTTSRLYYKGILDGKSRAVFGGTVFVRPGAIKADAHQEDKNLVLSEEAEVDSKPSLEIYADDVKCGHGATAGAVAEDAIFYMRSRGLDAQTASALLIKGFAGEILERVGLKPLRLFLGRRVSRALAGAQFGR